MKVYNKCVIEFSRVGASKLAEHKVTRNGCTGVAVLSTPEYHPEGRCRLRPPAHPSPPPVDHKKYSPRTTTRFQKSFLQRVAAKTRISRKLVAIFNNFVKSV